PMQLPGDCKQKVCDGSGVTVDQDDDLDLPDDSNPCTDDVCTAGVASNPFLMKGASCGMNGAGEPLVCVGMGQCTGGNDPTGCQGSDDECKQGTCTAGVCGVTFTADDTLVAMQSQHDCLKNVCDGNGNIVSKPDNPDVPLDDGNACTSESCAAGAPQHP